MTAPPCPTVLIDPIPAQAFSARARAILANNVFQIHHRRFAAARKAATVINAVVRSAPPIALDGPSVSACLDFERRPGDVPFAIAWTRSLRALRSHERVGRLAGVTGHVAESVVELLLADLGYHPIHHFIGPGQHGIDLLMLSPAADHLLAIEVKGTLRPGCVPRLSRRAMTQMSAAWVDKSDNPGMAESELHSEDVYGAVIAVNFADMTLRAAASDDFVGWRPVVRLDDLPAIDTPVHSSANGGAK